MNACNGCTYQGNCEIETELSNKADDYLVELWDFDCPKRLECPDLDEAEKEVVDNCN